MCGILSIINTGSNVDSQHLLRACSIIRHRGPDDEGLLTWSPGSQPVVWAGSDTSDGTHSHWKYPTLTPGQRFKVGFGHRRLSILDLSPAGHQPMIFRATGLALTFNGEIYNYIEIKEELLKLGHQFVSTSDTEVILHAWAQWGPDCLHRFNGMFAFVLLDFNKSELYAVRDRFGVKPLYYYEGASALYVASEIKQIRTSPDYQFSFNEKIARQFLATGAVDHTEQTFDTRIMHVPPGYYLFADLKMERPVFQKKQWYKLEPKRWSGNEADAVAKFRQVLTDAVSLRLRSDVTVGSCLSGGLDSSAIVCIAADLLKAKGDFAGQETVTACYDNARFDEWKFAEEVIRKTNARPHRVFPSFRQLQDEVDAFIWHQDEPTGSTSQFSQWAVFKGTHEAGLKVMIDGQGADEQLAGYGGNDLPFYAGLMANCRLFCLIDETRHYKKEKGNWPVGFLLNAAKLRLGQTLQMPSVDWLQGPEPASIHAQPARSLRENLLRQVYGEPLPALLRYEDHNSMAWSVESRTPFMDYRLLEFTLGLPARYIYRNGVRKSVLRKAMHGIIPAAIESRKDKMGFVTPEELWLKGEGQKWFLDAIGYSCQQFGSIINEPVLTAHVNNIIAGKEEFSFVPWRVAVLGLWYKNLSKASIS